MRFRFFRLRFHFEALGPLYFPAGKPGNILRGAFGTVFRGIACAPRCADARACERRAECAYARTFEPASLGGGPSGFSDWPRPFVFRASHLDGRRVIAGQTFHFDMHLFEARDPAIAQFVLAFSQLAREGLGPGRGRAVLTGVDQLDLEGAPARRVFDGTAVGESSGIAPSDMSLIERAGPARHVRVRFVTPTELKHDRKVTRRPEFGILMGRIRDRLSMLSDLYGDGALEMDFAGFGERARRVAMTRCEVELVDVTRLSTRTGQRHPLGGFVGVAEYEGDLGEFVPFLEAARFSGVGRQTAWGNGEMAVTVQRGTAKEAA